MDRETVEKVARSAHLKLTEEELEIFSRDLGDILGYFAMLDEAPDCEGFGIDPIGVADVLRDDEPYMELEPDALLQGMDTYDNYVRGPRLL